MCMSDEKFLNTGETRPSVSATPPLDGVQREQAKLELCYSLFVAGVQESFPEAAVAVISFTDELVAVCGADGSPLWEKAEGGFDAVNVERFIPFIRDEQSNDFMDPYPDEWFGEEAWLLGLRERVQHGGFEYKYLVA